MFPYRVKYTESKYDIQNNDLLYKIPQNAKILSTFLKVRKRSKQSFRYVDLCISSIIRILKTLYFGDLCIYIYIYIYIYYFCFYTCRSLTRVGLYKHFSICE